MIALPLGRSRSVALLLCGLGLGLGACTDDGVESNPFNATDGATTGAASSGEMPDSTSVSASGMVSVGSGDASSGSDDATSLPPVDDTGLADTSTGIPTDDSTTMGVLDTGTDDAATSTGPADTGNETSSSTGGDDGPMGTPCPIEVIEDLPFSIPGSTAGQGSEFGSGCGGGGAPDSSYTLTAAVDGFYVFDTFGSTFDTVLYVLDGDCGGPVLACSDDAVQPPQSQVSVDLTAGQTVTVVVDGFGVAGGNYVLNGAVFGGTCPNDDLGNAVPQTTTGSTSASDNTLFGTCGGNTAGDESFTWTAPAAGVYQIDTEGSAFDTVLYVRNGDCNGNQIGCNDDTGGMPHSRVNVNLANNQTIVIVVDGAGIDSGDFTLNILEATDSGNCCTTHATTGCDDTGVEDCVCAIDSFCCDVQWDGLCVAEAISPCNAICP